MSLILWTTVFGQKPEFKRGKEADRESYIWDKLIERLADPTANSIGEAGPQLNDIELALRAMARENRFARRLLGRGLREFLEQATGGKVRSRLLIGPSGIIYVFVFFEPDEDASFRIAEVGNRCFIARHKVGAGDIVIGVGITRYAVGSGSGTSTQSSHEDEYPAT